MLEAFLAVPRERFVPPALRGIAYVDEDIPLGGGRYLMEPMVLARLLQLAAIGPATACSRSAAATGYATALLARLARSVVAVESDAGARRRGDGAPRASSASATSTVRRRPARPPAVPPARLTTSSCSAAPSRHFAGRHRAAARRGRPARHGVRRAARHRPGGADDAHRTAASVAARRLRCRHAASARLRAAPASCSRTRDQRSS